MDTSDCLDALPWETRNLGVESFAVRPAWLENPDRDVLMRALRAVQAAHDRFFVQARVAANTAVATTLAQCGFYFVETVLSPQVSLTRYPMLDRFIADPARVLPRRSALADLEVVEVPDRDHPLAAAVRLIAGASFVDDRFHVDHNCDHATANRRYQLWVDDLLHDASVRCHVLRLHTEPIAFLVSRRSDLLLAAFAPRYAGAGLGEYFWLRVLQDLRHGGTKVVRTVISTSNVSALNLYVRLGFKFAAPRATFHLWGHP